MSYNSLFGLGSHSADANLEGYWNLQDDAASTAVVDSSGNSLTGTLTNAGNTSASSITGPNGWATKAIDLDGTDDYISLPGASGLDIAGDFTFLSFARVDIAGSSLHLLGAYSPTTFVGYGVRYNSYLPNVWTNSGGWFAGSGTAIDFNWHHWAAKNESGVSYAYIDGTSYGSASKAAPVSYTGAKALGAVAGGASGRFNGALSVAAIFSRALNTTEIGEHKDGPELENVTAPVLATDGTVTSGTWQLPSPFTSGSNGSISRTTYLHLASDDSLIATLTVVDPDFSSYVTAGLTYYVIERASNDGGYDAAEDTPSADTTIAGGGGTDALTATGISTGAPSVGSPAIGQIHALSATGIATGAPSVGSPSLGQVHSLTAIAIATAATSVGSPALGQVHVLTATAVATGTPSVGSPALGQIHALAATGIATDAPSVSSPILDAPGGTDALTATGVAAGSPSVGSPTIGQVHSLTATGVVAGSPSVGLPMLAQVHILSAMSLSAGSPTVGTPALNGSTTFKPWLFAASNISIGL